ncbi:MAG TPA: hypothetical protein VFG83_17355 [Kofleriaceae bacterium]|nr:hypothetical protein [Kofleriaceae bacterium]
MNAMPQSPAEKKRAMRILAKSICKQLLSQGYSERQIVSLATELLSEVTAKMAAAAPVRE